MSNLAFAKYYLFDDFIPSQEEILKSKFLKSITASNGNYKRFLGTPLRYGGGKSLAVGLILENFPNDVKRIIKDSTVDIMNNITNKISRDSIQYGRDVYLPWNKNIR